ncbi:glycosyltransferase family 2 protein, partial [Caballeronia calidae]|uniref:glycosyltransferase family 2 protein n=1 Tax=Caballeronia calidae TaxID=1777139 RepID=UPI000B0EFB5D
MNCAPPIKLTIAIPTFNRARYLRINLQRLAEEMPSTLSGKVEILVSDNHSTDETPTIVADAIHAGLVLRYIRNERNLGSDANIAQCFNEARGDYIQILGDDDIYVRGTL